MPPRCGWSSGGACSGSTASTVHHPGRVRQVLTDPQARHSWSRSSRTGRGSPPGRSASCRRCRCDWDHRNGRSECTSGSGRRSARVAIDLRMRFGLASARSSLGKVRLSEPKPPIRRRLARLKVAQPRLFCDQLASTSPFPRPSPCPKRPRIERQLFNAPWRIDAIGGDSRGDANRLQRIRGSLR